MEDGEIVEGVPMEEETSIQLPKQPKTLKSPHETLKESKAVVEETVSQILSIKNESKPKSLLREFVSQMFIHFVHLRQANRAILMEEDSVKAETEKAKAPVDFTTLQLHNLMYEKSHYVKAIKACKDFKSKYPDIELVPEEEFFRDASEHIKGPVLSDDSSHNLMLKRLNYELHQRKELCSLHEKLEQRKKSLLETIANRKKFLSSLPSHLKSLKKASLPVQNQLGVLHTKKLKQHNSAELLPPPLYVIYSQLSAQKEAFGENIEMEIVGSLKDAQSFARQQANKEAGMSLETCRMDDDVPDEEDEGQRRRKRPKKAQSKENNEQAGVYQVHPLKIILHIYDDEDSDPKAEKLITLKFEYMLKLNFICVGVEGSHEGPDNNVLCNLFPDDSGLELPHQSAKLFVQDAVVFGERRNTRPYKWAQHLAGIDFLPEVAPLLSGHETPISETGKGDIVASGLSLYRQQNRVQTVIQRIRSRKKAQLALSEQLDFFMKLKWPSLNYEGVPWALHTPSCELHGWSPIEPPLSQTSPLPVNDTVQVQEPADIDMDGKLGTLNGEIESIREDGELPSLVPVPSNVNDVKDAPPRVSNLDHSRQLALISKSVVSPVSKLKSQSFKKQDEDSDFLLDMDSDQEDRQDELELDSATTIEHESAKKSRVDHGVKEYSLVLTRKIDSDGRNLKLEAKIKISMEYPLRPPLVSVNIFTTGENYSENDDCKWYNELRAMEAEVNLHMLKMLPSDQENYVLAHQVLCLAVLFDYLTDEGLPNEKRKTTSVVDVGLGKPVIGRLLARSFRGRDRRKMISWKEMECTPGYPC